MSTRLQRVIGSLVLAGTSACAEGPHADVPAAPEPGVPQRVVLRKLSRAGYDRSVADVLGTMQRPARQLPADDPSAGFDDLAGAAAISPLQAELYEHAARALAAEAIADGPVRARVFVCDPGAEGEAACIGRIADALQSRAWRRPLRASEQGDALALLADTRARGGDFDDAVEALVATTFLSPHFLFRVELEPEGGEGGPLPGHEIATRLSYFLHGSTPDDALLAAAAAGELDDAEGIDAAALRLLDEPGVAALADDFAGQWLGIRALDDVFKDTHTYTAWDAQLRASMATELRMEFLDLVAEDRDVRELLVSSHGFVDRRLGELYGLADAPAPEDGFVRRDLASALRIGWLTRAGVLSVLAHPFTTSPTRRGAWVLESLLCMPMPDPPPEVDAAPIHGGATKRELLASHASTPACAGCHRWTDPIGLALEPYDGIGRWRSRDGDVAIETAGELPDGRRFADVVELAALLAEDPAFMDCAVRKTMTHATGRVPTADDQVHIDAIVDELAASGGGMRTLLRLVARSEPMRRRAVEVPE